MIASRDHPTVRSRGNVIGAQGDHGLDGNDHTRTKAHAPPLLTKVGNVRLLMHVTANTMTYIIAQDAKSMRLGK